MIKPEKKKNKIINKTVKTENEQSTEIENNNNQQIIILEKANKNIKYVVHMADIHIRRTEREDEYRHLIENLYNVIVNKNLNENNSVIVVCGDVLDNSTNLHPIGVAIVRDFFMKLLEICDVICIAGNHDVLYFNKKYNSLESIIGRGLRSKHNVYLLLENSLYEYNNIIFSNTTIDASVVTRCNKKIEKNMYKCALYHGTLMNYNYKLKKIEKNKKNNEENDIIEQDESNNSKFTVKNFSDFDFVFMGDIHEMQFITPTIAYSGSICQNTMAESIDKGIILWNLKEKKGEFIKVPNKYGKLKILIDEKGNNNLKIDKNLEYADVEIECRSMNINDIKKVNDILTENNITLLRKSESYVGDDKKMVPTLKIGDTEKKLNLIKTTDDVKKIVMGYLKQRSSISNEKMKNISTLMDDILKDVNISNCGVEKNIKLVKLTFNNMSIYGENNTLDFEKFKGIMGINQGNDSGKSWIIDITLYSIFGKCTRGSKEDLLNINADKYTSEIILDVNNIRYKIERNGSYNNKKDKNSQFTEKVRFFENDKNISDKKTKTDELIQNLICSYNDFLRSSFVTQKTVEGFSEMNGKERKDYLCKIGNLEVFEKIYKRIDTAYNSATRCESIAKSKFETFKKYGNTPEEINKEIIQLKDKSIKNINKYEDELTDVTTLIYNKKIAISKLEVQLVDLNKYIKNMNKPNEKEKETLMKKRNFVIKEIKNCEKEMNKLIKDKKNMEKEFKNMDDIDKIINLFEKKKEEEIVKLKNNIELKRKTLWINTDVDFSKYKKKKINDDKKQTINKIKNVEDEIIDIEKNIKINEDILNKKITEISKEKYDKYLDTLKDKTSILKIIDEKNKQIEEYNIKLENLKDHKYDKNCKFCMNNTITKEKKYLEELLNEMEQNMSINKKELNKINNYLNKNKNIIEKYEDYINNVKNKNDAEKLNINLNYKKNVLIKEKNIYENEFKDIENMIANYEKYLNNKNIEDEINKIEKEIDLKNKEVCKEKIRYDELDKQLSKINLTIKETEIIIEKNKNELKDLDQKQKIYDIEIDEYNAQKDKILLKEQYEKDIDDDKKMLNDWEKQLDNIKKKLDKEKMLLNEYTLNENSIGIYYKNYEEEKEKKMNYKLLKDVFETYNISDDLLEKDILPGIVKNANLIFSSLKSRKINVLFRSGKIDIVDENNININSEGGYKRFFNNLVFRIALSRDLLVKTNFFIVDEAFDSTDIDNCENMKNLVKYVRAKYDWAMVISHNENITDTFDNYIRIKSIGNKKSKIIIK